jgi:hypothetical protein
MFYSTVRISTFPLQWFGRATPLYGGPYDKSQPQHGRKWHETIFPPDQSAGVEARARLGKVSFTAKIHSSEKPGWVKAALQTLFRKGGNYGSQ